MPRLRISTMRSGLALAALLLLASAVAGPAAAQPANTIATQINQTGSDVPASDRPPVAHGVHLAWDDGIGPAEYNKMLGRNASIFGDFFDVGSSPLRDQKYNFSFCADRMMRHAGQVLSLGYGAAFSIAVMPWEGLQFWGKNCSDGTYIYQNCTKQGSTGNCTAIPLNCTQGDPMYPNGYTEPFLKLIDQLVDLGLPIIIRWGHEMNGNWYPWGDQAVLFTRVWQEFMGMMRPETRAAVKMEWAPNAVPDCEWRPADYDPYLPFWPGDDMVDIVGMSIYFYGTEDHTINEIVPDGTLWNWMDGISKFNSYHPICENYRRMSVGRDKPFFFSETAAAHHVGKDGPTPLQVKQSWWKQLYNESTFDRYNLTRAIVWFEIRKEEWGDDRDFRLVIGQSDEETGIMNLWLNDIPEERMAWGNGAEGWCDRTWWLQMFDTGPTRLANGTGALGAACPPVYTQMGTLTVVQPTATATGLATTTTTSGRPSGADRGVLVGLTGALVAALLAIAALH